MSEVGRKRNWAPDALYLGKADELETTDKFPCRVCGQPFKLGEEILRRRWGEQGRSHLLCGYFTSSDRRTVPMERDAREAVEAAKLRASTLAIAADPSEKPADKTQDIAPVVKEFKPLEVLAELVDASKVETTIAEANDNATRSSLLRMTPDVVILSPAPLAIVPSNPYGVASASRGALMRHCMAWTRFAIDEGKARLKKWVRWGLALHDVFERHNAKRSPLPLLELAALYDLDEVQRLALPSAIESLRAYNPPALACAELAVAWNPETNTGRELGRNIDRAYDEHGLDRTCEIPGTSDLCWMDADGETIVVLDLKTGFWGSVDHHEDQLLLLAVMLRRAWGTKGGARIGVLHLVDGEVVLKLREVASYDLDAIEEEYRERFGVLRAMADLPTKPGRHCRDRYCPALDSCPETTKSVEALLPPNSLIPRMRLFGPVATMEEARYRVKLKPLLATALEHMDADLKAFVKDNGNIKGEDGKDLWGWFDAPAQTLLATDKAEEILTAELGGEVGLALSKSITKSGIKEAAKALGKSQKGTLDEITAKLDAVGAVVRTTGKKCGFINE